MSSKKSRSYDEESDSNSPESEEEFDVDSEFEKEAVEGAEDEVDPELLGRKNEYEDENMRLLAILGLYVDPAEEERKLKAAERAKADKAKKQAKLTARLADTENLERRQSARLSGQAVVYREIGENDDEIEWESYDDEEGFHIPGGKKRGHRRRRSSGGGGGGWGNGGKELYSGKDRERYHQVHKDALGTCKEAYPLMGEEKVYDQTDGSTCHQCRQKIIGDKSSCSECDTMNGWFCGTCLQARYGENLLEVSKRTDWRCPSCRGFCNCSICRNRMKFGATGALAPRARREGYPSAAHYLVYKNFVDPITGLKTPLHPDGTLIEGEGEQPREKRQQDDEDDEEDEDDEKDEIEQSASSKRRRRALRDPFMPKAGRSAYNIFVGERSRVLKEESPEMSFGDMGRQMGKDWRELTSEQKKRFTERSREEHQKQNQAIKEYADEKKREEQAQAVNAAAAAQKVVNDDGNDDEAEAEKAKQPKKKRSRSKKNAEEKSATPKKSAKSKVQKTSAAAAALLDASRTPEANRVKSHTVVGTNDSSNDDPQTNLVVDGFEILSLGQLVPDNAAFHSPEILVPQNYEVVHSTARFMKSKKEPEQFQCRITLGSDQLPYFQVWRRKNPNVVGSDATPTGAWRALLKQHLEPLQWQLVADQGFDGAELFGLEHPQIVALLEALPKREEFITYKAAPKMMRWTLKRGDLVAVRTHMSDDERYWIASVAESKPVKVPFSGVKGQIRIRWFEVSSGTGKVYKSTTAEDLIDTASIFHAQFNSMWQPFGKSNKFVLLKSIHQFDL